MTLERDTDLARLDGLDTISQIRERTPARIFVRRVGGAYDTATQLELRSAHAAARDAVKTEFDWQSAFSQKFLTSTGLFEVQTEARNKREYLMRPDLGRKFGAAARSSIQKRCVAGCDLQIVIGDGLSATAVGLQAEPVAKRLMEIADAQAWSVGQVFAVRHCRVGLMNEIGEMLDPQIIVLLIGERPGLATAKSLSAYLAYRPRNNHTDAQRNLISNIHDRGISCALAAERIANLAANMMRNKTSGVLLRSAQELPES